MAVEILKEPIDGVYIENEELVRWLTSLYENIRDYHRDNITKNWEDYEKAYQGDMWPTKLPSYKSDVVVNLIYSIIDLSVSLMGDTRPYVGVLPTKKSREGSRDTAELLEKCLDGVWDRLNLELMNYDVLTNSHLYGTGFYKVTYNREAAGGIGELEITAPDPWSVLLDKCASKIEDCRYVIFAQPVDLMTIRRMYPRNGGYVKGESTYSTYYPKTRFKSGPFSGFFNWFKSGVKKEDVSYAENIYPMAMVIEAWVKDDAIEEVEEMLYADDGSPLIDESGKAQLRQLRRYKYPGGRLITIAQKVLLQDVPNPYSHQRFPIVPVYNHKIPSDIWGVSEVTNLLKLNQELNKRRSQITLNLDLLNSGVWIIDANSGVKPDTLTNRPALVITKNPASTVDRKYPPPMPPDAYVSIQDIERSMETVSGMELRPTPRPNISGVSIENIQAVAHSRVRKKFKLFAAGLKDVAELSIAIMRQFYQEGRVIRIADVKKGYDFIEWHAEDYDSQYDYKVNIENAMPLSKLAKFQQNLLLYQLGAIDQSALLDAVDYPDRENIIKRMETKMAMGIPPLPSKPRQRLSKPATKAQDSRNVYG